MCASGLWADPPHYAKQGFIMIVRIFGVLFLIGILFNRLGEVGIFTGVFGYCFFGFRPV